MDTSNDRTIRRSLGGLAIEMVLLLAGLALIFATAVKRMSGTDGAVHAAHRAPMTDPASR
ncbi:MAG TPA: hypothetical protein VKR29_11890 [Candidatus Binataceae bacterium]|nr:hypothetical protein [Candidatus Binataceae bacterium]